MDNKVPLRIPCFELLVRYVISNTFLVSGLQFLVARERRLERVTWKCLPKAK